MTLEIPSYGLIGNRVPTKFFATQGHGESDNDIHTGSFHLALREAGIEWANIMTYSSILPAKAVFIDKSEYQSQQTYGEVMEIIMAQTNCNQGETATAGLAWSHFSDKKSGERRGGFVCEYGGPKKKEDAEEQLRTAINELHANGYEDFDLNEPTLMIQTVHPQKRFGTALVALCVVEFRIPIRKIISPQAL